jgi:hypothetical protein
VEEGNPEWVGEWIWLSLAKIGSQKFKTLFSSPTLRYLHITNPHQLALQLMNCHPPAPT